MEKRVLGKSNIKAGFIGMGLWAIGGDMFMEMATVKNYLVKP
jgi:aryl-alcohol dehydrogenase-like predicted oxidoreductase